MCLCALILLNTVTLKGVIGSSHRITDGKNTRIDMEKGKVRLSELQRNNVIPILVLGASRRIGFNLIKQYHLQFSEEPMLS